MKIRKVLKMIQLAVSTDGEDLTVFIEFDDEFQAQEFVILGADNFKGDILFSRNGDEFYVVQQGDGEVFFYEDEDQMLVL
jgi:hypothetical protein